MGLFAPRTFNQIMKDMLTKLKSSTPLTDLNFGSIWTTMLEAAAQEDDEQYFQMFEIIRGYNLDTVFGADLIARAAEYSLEKLLASPSSSFVTISDSAITRVATDIYSGLPGPAAGSTSVNASSGTGFAASGSIIIGRGTPNSETIAYSSITTFPNYVRFNLSGSTANDHGTDEIIVKAQGGDRTITASTVILVPASDANEEVQFTLDQSATILDGESETTGVLITCTVPGSIGNVPIGAVHEFSSSPFPTATVRNPSRITNGVDDETDQELRDRIKSTIQGLSRGTGRAITAGVVGLVSAEDAKRVVSMSLRDTTIPAEVVKAFLDDGTGWSGSFAHIGTETVVANATGGEKFLSTANTPLLKAMVETQSFGPFNIANAATLIVELNGKVETITFAGSDFAVIGAGTAQEVVRRINASAAGFEARISDVGTKARIFSRSNTDEEIRVTGGTANVALAFPTDQKFTTKLFLERGRDIRLLNKDGRTAQIESGVLGPYNLSTGPLHLSLVLDGKVNNIQKVWFNPADYSPSTAVTALAAANTIKAKASGLTAVPSSNATKFAIGSLTSRSADSKIRIVSDFTAVLNDEGSPLVDRTVEAKTSGSNVTLFATNLNYLHLGHSEVPFDSVFVKLTTLASASITPTFEYWNGTAWTTVGVNDGTIGFSQSGHILFPAPQDWAPKTVGSATAYWLRIRRTNAGLVTAPVESRLRICGANEIFQFSETEIAGADLDYRLNRFLGQIELESPLAAGDIVTLGSLNTRATATSDAGPFISLSGLTLTVEVDGFNRSITFLAGDFVVPSIPTALEAATAINARMPGVTAVTVDAGTRVRVQTNRYSTGTLKVVSTSPANAVLNFPTVISTSFPSHSPALESLAEPWVLPASGLLIVIADDNFASTFTVPVFSERTLTSASPTVLVDPALSATFPNNNEISGFDLVVIDGPAIGQRKTILSYVAGSGTITLASALSPAPVAGNKVQIIPREADQIVSLLNNKQITLLSTRTLIQASDSGRRLQIASLKTGEDAAVAIPGGTANVALGFAAEARGIDAYRYRTGLGQLAQWTIDGKPDDPDTYPGLRAAGVQVEVIEAVKIPITASLVITTQDGITLPSIANNIRSAVSNYINRLTVGADVVRSDIVVAARGVSGVFDVNVVTPASNIAIADNELARISDSDISLV